MVDNFNHSQKVQNCPKSPKFKFGVLGTSSNGPFSRKKIGNQKKPFFGLPSVYSIFLGGNVGVSISCIAFLKAYCDALLKDGALIAALAEKKFDVAVIDLFYSECSITLAHHLKQVDIYRLI